MSVREKIAVRVARNGIIVNTLLSVFKLFVGINSRSAAMISDAAHSLSDVFAEFIVIAGVKLAGMVETQEIIIAVAIFIKEKRFIKPLHKMKEDWHKPAPYLVVGNAIYLIADFQQN